MPTLMAMHERWYPEQIAAAISEIDFDLHGTAAGKDPTIDYTFCRMLVLKLAQVPQRRAEQPSGRPMGGPVQLSGTLRDALGTCKSCGGINAEFITTIEGKAIAVCGECYEKQAALDDEELEKLGAAQIGAPDAEDREPESGG